ncbi:unnamed protein product [Aphanomyces euteiches]
MVPNSANSSNAVVQDVHLLFATDDQLRDDLAYVCSLLDSPERKPSPPSSSITRTSKSPEESKPTLSHQDRRKREILELRRQVDILKNQLLDAKQQATGKPDMSAWERAARDQMYAKSKSISENEQLRAQVEENATFIEDMTRVLRKRPRLSVRKTCMANFDNVLVGCPLGRMESLQIGSPNFTSNCCYSCDC